jgi:hypothetical protein
MWKDENGVSHVSDKPPAGGTVEGLQEFQYQDRIPESSGESAKRFDTPDTKADWQSEHDMVGSEGRDRARSMLDKDTGLSPEYERQRQVELERNRLKSQINYLKQDRDQPLTAFRSNARDQAISILESELKKLEIDPDQYFYDKQQRDSRSSNIGVDPRTGQVVPILPFSSK